MTTDKEIKNYINSIKKLFPIYSKKEREYVKNLEKNINKYVHENKSATIDHVIEKYGEPTTIVHNYIDIMDIDDIINKISKKKIIKRIIISVIVWLLLGTTVYYGFFYKCIYDEKHTKIIKKEVIHKETYD